MSRNEMRQPLKRLSPAQRLWRRCPPALVMMSGVVALGFASAGLWLSRPPPPGTGEPVVVAAIPEQAEIITSSITPADDAEADARDQGPADPIDPNAIEIIGGEQIDDAGQMPAAQVEDIAPEDAMAPEKHEAMIVVPPHRPLKKAPVEAVTEKTDQGPLPRIASGGKTPFDVYSQVMPLSVVHSDWPKITLVLGGMGINARLTKKAVELLPGDVTLGFAPYGENLQSQVNAARAGGHEILLQVPMEPVGYPGANPGPSTLLTDAKPEQNLAALKWLMSRFAGYSGITNYMGARLLVTEDALRPVMKEVKARGLVYLEDGSVSMTLSSKLGQELRLPVQRARLVIDAEPTSAAIKAALAKLEQEAAENGSAIATGSGLDVTIETVAEWAKTLQQKGILLVPVSAAYKGRAT
ncbi:MAG: divergent polysaccharide deacetylase family protein [Aestuariivirga sp.]|uniref:divergent polysaccharide deacetylase family protein n=1 Tax=Aestuariivirga sp. TaxID=2650926 RepID=UPI0025C5AB89|nr:divergent polysaccharide deacetylase family protein [Aestuariivirga sp.]MCA3560120.1 divergent polysaccharide deacetylase family protein [Aestuariivirga sp.]